MHKCLRCSSRTRTRNRSLLLAHLPGPPACQVGTISSRDLPWILQAAKHIWLTTVRRRACKAACAIDIFKCCACAIQPKREWEWERERLFRLLPLCLFRVGQIWFSYLNFRIKPYTEHTCTHISVANMHNGLRSAVGAVAVVVISFLSKLRTLHDFHFSLPLRWCANDCVCVCVTRRSHHLNTTKYYCVHITDWMNK